MRDKEVSEIEYASIPKIDLNKVIVDYQTVSKVFNKTYSNPSGNSEQRYIDSNLEELNTHFKDNKKIISYMVKEFEMKELLRRPICKGISFKNWNFGYGSVTYLQVQ